MEADAFLRTCNHFAAPTQEIAVDLEDDNYESDEWLNLEISFTNDESAEMV